MDDWLTIFRTGMWRLWYKLTPEGKRRYFGDFMEKLHQTKYVQFRALFSFNSAVMPCTSEPYDPSLFSFSA